MYRNKSKMLSEEELFRLGEIAKSQNEWRKALSIWNEYRRRFPQNAIGYAKSIKTMILLEDLDDAENLLSASLTRFHDNPDIRMCIGEISMKRRQWSKAIDHWHEFRKIFPKHPTGFICGIVSLRNSGNIVGAYNLVKEALKILPNEPGIIAQSGELAMCRKDWTEAKRIWEELRRRFSEQPVGYARGVNTLIRAGLDKEAETLLENALDLFPDDIGVVSQTGELAMHRNDWGEASIIWKNIRKQFPNQTVGYLRGIKAMSQSGELESAELLAERALNLFPNDLRILSQVGQLRMHRNKWQSATQIWEDIRQKNPDDLFGYVLGIESLLKANDYMRAETVLKDGNSKKFDLKNSYNQINDLYLGAHDWVGALRLMINCDSNLTFNDDWSQKVTKALNKVNLSITNQQRSYDSYISISQAMELLIQIRKWIDWRREETLNNLLLFLESFSSRTYSKPATILSGIICDNSYAYLHGGVLRYTNDDDLVVLFQELLSNENYWFESYKENPVIFDCGTHFGLSLYYFKMLYPNSKIFAFEPNPELYEIAKQNVLDNNWHDIKLMPYAIGPEVGLTKFYIPQKGTAMAGSLLRHVNNLDLEVNFINIQSIRLSEMIDGKIDFLKLDVEGAEYEVVKDIEEFLPSIQNIFCEFHQGGCIKSRHMLAILDMLEKASFELRISVSNNFKSLLQNRPLQNITQKCSTEIWATRI
jgi:FkbM family methyltransferase